MNIIVAFLSGFGVISVLVFALLYWALFLADHGAIEDND